MEPPDALRAFRRSLYESFHRRRDALFELVDAILTADGTAPSPAHLSLEASHRRGWGSLYAALDRGRLDEEALRKLLARHPLAGTEGEPSVYAVDTSVWDRCDAECSPERGYYYHPSRHSAGQPIVAGWSYQFIAQLGFVRESWTAPVDVECLRPAQDANAVASEQVRSFLRRYLPSRRRDAAPLFVFDAGYDPVKVQQGLEGSPCQILVRLRAGRRFYGDPSLCDPPEHIGRPRRHGPKMKCNDPSTWPEPSAEHRCEDAGYGCVRVRAWAELHPKVHRGHQRRTGQRGPGGSRAHHLQRGSRRSSEERPSVSDGAGVRTSHPTRARARPVGPTRARSGGSPGALRPQSVGERRHALGDARRATGSRAAGRPGPDVATPARPLEQRSLRGRIRGRDGR